VPPVGVNRNIVFDMPTVPKLPLLKSKAALKGRAETNINKGA
jgi:hypothetical protein